MTEPGGGVGRNLVIGVAVLVLSSLVALRQPSVEQAAGADAVSKSGDASAQGPVETGGRGLTPGGGATAGARAAQGPRASARAAALECAAGRNGGATDVGVTGNRIALASTNVRSGPGSSFLGLSYLGMQAVVRRVNAQGGVCGRLLDLYLIDDGWDAVRGAGFIRNFAAGKYFALPVVPSSEGLTVAIKNRTILEAGVPVVGTDGMLKEQYLDPWVWPVATATVSMMRIMAKHAHQRGACSYGIVFDSRYKFGKEGADAFREFAESLRCVGVRAFVGIEPGRPDYSAEIQTFNEKCNPCDFVAMLLEPGTAYTWVAGQPQGRGFGRLLTGGAQPLFNERFAKDCGRRCGEMLVWTGYNPPIGRKAADDDVSRYVSDIRSIDPHADVYNQFLEGAYLGMKVFVEALRRVGPDLTRERLRAVMDDMSFRSGLAGKLHWTQRQRFANCSAQAFRIVSAAGGFAGFAEAGTGFIRDPWCGRVTR